MMMTTTRNDIKDRLIHNQSPYPTKDKVLSYTIPVDHSETLLFCSSNSTSSSSNSSSSSASSGSSSSSSVNGVNNSQDNGSLNFITADDDPCNGRDSLASFLDEGLGTSLDGVDEIASPIFPALGRNDSGVFSSDEGTAAVTTRAATPAIPVVTSSVNQSAINVIPRPTTKLVSASASGSSSENSGSVTEVVSWKPVSSSSSSSNGTSANSNGGGGGSSILLSPSGATATIAVVTDSVTGIPSIICTSTAAPPPPPPPPVTNNSGSNGVSITTAGNSELIKTGKQSVNKQVSSVSAASSGKGNSSQQQQSRSKSMPLGRQGPQKCTICDKVFSNASALTKHKLTHSDERRHACATCGKAFKRQDHLNGHMLTHRNKKPFECKSKGCGKSYCDARSLRRHVENRHGHEVLESMNLGSTHQKHGNGKSSHSGHGNSGKHKNTEPQLELMHVTPIKVEPLENCSSDKNKSKVLDHMPVLQPEQQLQTESSINNKNCNSSNRREKTTSSSTNAPMITLPPPPVLPKLEENRLPSGVPIVVKRENVSVFDFDENVEDVSAGGANHSALTSSLPPEKVLSSAIKVSGIIDSTKLGQLADIRLIQEWSKRLGDSKVALFLASTSTATSSIAQLTGPMTTSIQLTDGSTSVTSGGTVTMSAGPSHAFIPSSENGIFSVTPISIVPTSSGEFAFKAATLSSVPGSSTESPKPIYILPPEPLISTSIPPPVVVPTAKPVNSTPPKLEPILPTNSKGTGKGSKIKSDSSKEKKSGIGASLANRIKTKLKAGSLKKLGKNSACTGGGPLGESKTGSDKVSETSSVSSNGKLKKEGKSNVLLPQLQLPTTNGMPTIHIASGGGGGIVSWCEPPKDATALNGGIVVEDDPMSGECAVGEGEDKPVECSICCRRFKNTPALNGHMRLHGGYFKKESEGPKKKESSKDHTHSAPLQTASVSVRALIEEKIKERRNNLLKLAAAAAAEKAAAANENTSGTTEQRPPSQQQHQPAVGTGKSKSEKNSYKLASANHKMSSSGQEAQLQQPCIKVSPAGVMENVKLKMEPTCSTEKDKNCDHEIINSGIGTSIISSNIINSGNSNINSSGIATTLSLQDSSFQDFSILIGGDVVGNGGTNMEIGGVDSGSGGSIQHDNGSNNDILLPQLVRDTSTTIHHHPQQQLQHNFLQQGSVIATNEFTGPVTGVEKSNGNITLLDCGINPEELCQAFHLIYVDGVGAAAVPNGHSSMLSFSDQETLGKVSKLFQEPLSDSTCLISNQHHSTLKSVTEPILVGSLPPPHSVVSQDDPGNLPWEWRNSTSSENTDSNLGNMHDCVNSLLCSTSSGDTPDESSTKDPVAGGGGYCYTPVLSPNSSFCLTPGPDSPFEAVAPPAQSLSFICPSPSIGNSSTYSSDPSMSSLVNPPSSVEAIFSPDQSQPPSIINSVSITPTAELQKYSNLQQQPELQNSVYINGYDGLQHHQQQNSKSQGFITVSPMVPMTLPHQTVLSNQMEDTDMDCLPPINTFPTMQLNGAHFITSSSGNNFGGSKEIVLHCPSNNNNYSNTLNFAQQQSFLPFEVYTTLPLPKKIADKWMTEKGEKGTRKSRVGSEFQAELPSFRVKKGKMKGYRSMGEKLWNPSILDVCTIEEVDKFLEFACCSAVPGGGMNKEYALHLLTYSKGNIREALLRLMEKLPLLPAKLRCYSYAENQRWSSEEIMAFQIALVQMGKDFAKISKAIGTKSGNECVCFYYFWKKVCPSEYQVMKDIWRDRLDHQKQLQQSHQQQSQSFLHNSNNNNNESNNVNANLSSNNNIISYISNGNSTNNNNLVSNHVNFLVPAQDFRGK